MTHETTRLTTVKDLIIRAKQAYYFSGNPIMADAEYDALERELRSLNPSDGLLKTVGAPVPPDNILVKTPHQIPMTSLNNSMNETEFRNWASKHNGPIMMSLKMDGGSVEVIYKDGFLVQGITRGDGEIGQDITANILLFEGLPKYVKGLSGSVRGEAILSLRNWKKADPDGQNPRNSGNGIMGRKSGKGCEFLEVIAFDIVIDGTEFKDEEEKFAKMCELGFNTAPHRLCRNANEAIEYYKEILAGRADLIHWIDGVVGKFNDIPAQNALGISGGRPKGATAFKFPCEGADSKITEIRLTVGHTGAINPTAILEAVEIAGTTVRKAFLNNWDEIERLDVAVGDTVTIVKRGDIIPKIVAVVKRPLNREIIEEPAQCPVCHWSTFREKNTMGGDGARTLCRNPTCPAKTRGKVKRWIKSLEILGIGEGVLSALTDFGFVCDPSDLYRMDKDKLSGLIVGDGGILGNKRAESILEEIDRKRKLTINQVIGSLGIRFLGKRRVKIIRKLAPGEFDTINDWFDYPKLRKFAEQTQIPNMVGTIIAGLDDNADLVKNYLMKEITIMSDTPNVFKTTQSASPTNAVEGKTFVLTGAMSRTRNEITKDIEAAGGIVQKKAAKSTDFLVAANVSSDKENWSNKLKAASKNGTSIISEGDLLEMLGR